MYDSLETSDMLRVYTKIYFVRLGPRYLLSSFLSRVEASTVPEQFRPPRGRGARETVREPWAVAVTVSGRSEQFTHTSITAECP